MDKFVLAGKAKTVFEIIELMAKGEVLAKNQEKDKNKMKLLPDSTYQIWPLSN